MNRASAKQGGKSSDSSPLSLLVHAADAQQQPSASGGRGGVSANDARKADQAFRHDLLKDKAAAAAAASFEEQQLMFHRKAAAEALQQQGGGLLPSLDFYQQNALAAAAAQQHQQQQQQLASLALASDIRSALAAAHLRQQAAAQLQNHDFLLARAAAAQGLGLGGAGGLQAGLSGATSIEKLQQDLELQRLEDLERRQQLLAAAGRAPIASRQQLEMQEAQARQEQLLQRESLLAATARNSLGGSSEVTPNPPAARRDSGKEELQKAPGSVIVPCRARGMPMDHNFKTAYFVIPENVQHGEELICSYFACRNAGIKFRYCTHCRVPVAKRNFRKRHKHGNSSSANDVDDDSNSGGEEDTSINSSNIKSKVAGIPSQVTTTSSPVPILLPPPAPPKKETPRKEKVAKVDGLQASPIPPNPKKNDPVLTVVKPSTLEATESSDKVRPKPVSDDSDSVSLPSAKAAATVTAAIGPPKISEERKQRWATLLGKRPPTKDGSAMSAWLMEVMSISDLDTPLKDPGEGGSSLLSPSIQNAAAAHMATMAISNALRPNHGSNGVSGLLPASASGPATATPDRESATSCSDVVAQMKSVLVKKKRPISLLHRDEGRKDIPMAPTSSSDGAANSSSAAAAAAAANVPGGSYSGSFAEWRDRKKQKVLSKKGGGP